MKLNKSPGMQFQLEVYKSAKELRNKIINSRSNDIYNFSNELCSLYKKIDKSDLSKERIPEFHNEIFILLSPFWISYIDQKNFYMAERYIRDLLEITKKWDGANANEKKIYKGALFYYLGITSIMGGDIDKGYLAFYQSLEEDRQLFEDKWPETYSQKFLQGKGNVFDTWVIKQNEFINQKLEKYQDQQEFSDKSLRRILNEKIDDPVMIVNFLYGISKIIHLNETQKFLSSNEFIDQINLNIISILGTCLERMIKKYYPVPKKDSEKKNFIHLKDHIVIFFDYHQERNLEMIKNYNELLDKKNELGEIRFIDEIIHNNTNEYIPKEINPICKDIIVFHQIRNLAAHELISENRISNNLEKIYQSIFNVFFFICQEKINK